MDRILKRGRKRLNYFVCFVYVVKCETVETNCIQRHVFMKTFKHAQSVSEVFQVNYVISAAVNCMFP